MVQSQNKMTCFNSHILTSTQQRIQSRDQFKKKRFLVIMSTYIASRGYNLCYNFCKLLSVLLPGSLFLNVCIQCVLSLVYNCMLLGDCIFSVHT